MKTFLLDIIPKIQKYSEKLDNITVLTNKHWVLIEEEEEEEEEEEKEDRRKIVFIFREKDNQLLISQNGRIEKGSWEYLGNKSLLIDRKDGSYLFKHGFVDDTILALQVDGKNKYALFVNENKFDNQLNTLEIILNFLKSKYSKENQKRVLNIPKVPEQKRSRPEKIISQQPKKKFNPNDHPQLISEVRQLKDSIENMDKEYSREIIISFCKEHSIKSIWANANPELTNLVVKKKIPIGMIEQLFQMYRNNQNFIEDLEKYLNEKL